ncbi:MAG: hypothetical protein QHC40_09845 [Sphingobium sp.]|nr:hypothetical protein [Sphingobium sp.]
MHRVRMAALALAMIGDWSAPALAQGLGVEGGYARADGHWGTELGAGYAFGAAGFRLTPGGGLFLADGETKVYGRVEGSYTLPASLTIGAGVRASSDNIRPYATVAMPVIPLLRLKGNIAPKYYGLGLTFGY